MSVGSIAQYPGVYDIIQNIWVQVRGHARQGPNDAHLSYRMYPLPMGSMGPSLKMASALRAGREDMAME